MHPARSCGSLFSICNKNCWLENFAIDYFSCFQPNSFEVHHSRRRKHTYRKSLHLTATLDTASLRRLFIRLSSFKALVMWCHLSLMYPLAPTSTHSGTTFHPLPSAASTILLYLSCFSKYQVVIFSSHGEVSSIHITIFNLSDHIIPSGLLPVSAMCGGNGWLGLHSCLSSPSC